MLCFLLTSCGDKQEIIQDPTPEVEKTDSDKSDQTKDQVYPEDPKFNETARFLAGMNETGSLSELEESETFKNFQANIDKLWEKTNKKLPVIRDWTEKEMAEANKSGGTLFYPFSGADFLHADLFFPEYDTIIMMALEPIGAMPYLKEIAKVDTTYDKYMSNLKKSMNHILKLSFFRTISMADDFQSELDGTLPVFLHFMTRTGHTVLYQEKVAITADGSLTTDLSNSTESTYVGNRYYIKKNGSDKVRTVSYFAVNVQNSPYYSRGGLYAKGLKTRKDLLAFLENADIEATYLKSASYLMHRETFSIIRDIILNESEYILQDDSGIPIQYFDRAKWDITLYGTYSFPISLFAERHQEDLKEAYQNKTENIKPLPFGIGYQYHKGTSNLMKAVRK
jgi:hypothetical protein